MGRLPAGPGFFIRDWKPGNIEYPDSDQYVRWEKHIAALCINCDRKIIRTLKRCCTHRPKTGWAERAASENTRAAGIYKFTQA